jgi:hypothetical protein
VYLGSLLSNFFIWNLQQIENVAHYAFMVLYKGLWLIVVAYPLWKTNTLKGSSAEELSNIFIWIVIPLLFIPWKYVFKNYILPLKK